MDLKIFWMRTKVRIMSWERKRLYKKIRKMEGKNFRLQNRIMELKDKIGIMDGTIIPLNNAERLKRK
ncbi:MAG: hypothetical protein EAX96_20895 [Candidatus Lokiarchaeota archaeon]|nr:hypothetical protein [Candidatus Lokiarchaeota archaeon]